jgi:hypothetical protein
MGDSNQPTDMLKTCMGSRGVCGGGCSVGGQIARPCQRTRAQHDVHSDGPWLTRGIVSGDTLGGWSGSPSLVRWRGLAIVAPD